MACANELFQQAAKRYENRRTTSSRAVSAQVTKMRLAVPGNYTALRGQPPQHYTTDNHVRRTWQYCRYQLQSSGNMTQLPTIIIRRLCLRHQLVHS